MTPLAQTVASSTATGRAYPDVSAVGDRVVIYNKGSAQSIGGTSASAPVFAAILTRVNEERLAAGKSTVGFVNPTLYANPSALHDIITGEQSRLRYAGVQLRRGLGSGHGAGHA